MAPSSSTRRGTSWGESCRACLRARPPPPLAADRADDQSDRAEGARPLGVEACAQFIKNGDGTIADRPRFRARLTDLCGLQLGEREQRQGSLVRVALRFEDR